MTNEVSLLDGDIVTVFVGPKRKQFQLHANVLKDRAPNFKAAFQKELKEGGKKELYIPDCDGSIFSLFVDWAYGNQVLRYQFGQSLNEFESLYSMAEKLGVESLKNASFDRIRDYCRVPSMITIPLLQRIWKNTKPRAGLRRFILDMVAHQVLCDQKLNVNDTSFSSMLKDHRFAVEFVETAQKVFKDEQTWGRTVQQRNNCFYHDHQETPMCE